MFDLFSDRAKKAFDYARTMAKVDRLKFITAEHVLLGVISDEDSAAAQILEQLGAKPAKIREAIETQLKNPLGLTPEKFNPGEPNEPSYNGDVKRILELAVEVKTGEMIGSEHLLLALLAENFGPIPAALKNLGFERADLMKEVRLFIDELDAQAGKASKDPMAKLPEGDQIGVIAIMQPGMPSASIDRIMDAISMIRGVVAVDVMRIKLKGAEEPKSPILTAKMPPPAGSIVR